MPHANNLESMEMVAEKQSVAECAYQQGYHAGIAGKGSKTNPHLADGSRNLGDDFWQWRMGHEIGFQVREADLKQFEIEYGGEA